MGGRLSWSSRDGGTSTFTKEDPRALPASASSSSLSLPPFALVSSVFRDGEVVDSETALSDCDLRRSLNDAGFGALVKALNPPEPAYALNALFMGFIGVVSVLAGVEGTAREGRPNEG